MSNFTPITTGAAANASVVNAPLYQLDAAITSLQSVGSVIATRPWAVIGGTAQPTSSDNVPVTANITHTGKLVRGQTTITSTGADMETLGNLAVGSGHHVFTGSNSVAIGDQNTVANSSLNIGLQNSSAANYTLISGASQIIEGGATYATIAGGYQNNIRGASLYAGILAGFGNIVAASTAGAILTGQTNFIQGSTNYCAILAGVGNNLNGGATGALIGGGRNNWVYANYAGIFTGEQNTVSHVYGFTGGGFNNKNYGTGSGIVAGNTNSITSPVIDSSNSVVGAGYSNTISDSADAGILAGQANSISGSSLSFIGSGTVNSISNTVYAAIVAGNNNTTGAQNSFIGGGDHNTIPSETGISSAIIAGSNNLITGGLATIINGSNNTITGSLGVIGGLAGHITHNYCFLWNSWIGSNFNSAIDAEFAVTAQGGIRFFTNTARSTGMTMAAGASSWTAVSSRALKGEFNDVQPRSILDRLLTVPIQTWKFKDGAGYHDHINLGPVAEDWDGAFADLLGKKTIAVSETEKLPAINEGDKMGVALAAIQGLTELVYDLRNELAILKA